MDDAVDERPRPAPFQRRVSFSAGVPLPSKASSRKPTRTELVSRSVGGWLREYLLEWQLTDARNVRLLQARANALAEAIEHSDAVVFVKPGGLCPFCNLASKALLEAAEDSRFSLHVADLFNEDRDALREMLGMPVLTWPVCFFKGRFVEGGGEAIATLHKEGALIPRICEAERVAFAPLAVAPTPQSRPLLLHQAGGGPWRACQQRIYGNVLRVIALLQIALLLPAHELDRRGQTAAALPLLGLLCIDALLFVCAGPTPWSPLGCVATLLVWRRRGTVAPLLPYKVTFVGLYFLLNAGAIGCRLSELTTAGDYEPSVVCDLVRSDGLVWTMVTNSIWLAAFRF